MSSPSSHEEQWPSLAAAAAHGDDDAYRRLTESIWPEVLRLAGRSRHLRGSGGSDDDVRNIAVAVLDKLDRNERQALTLYCDWHERHPEKQFRDWLTIVVTNVIRDYVRTGTIVEARGSETIPSKKRVLNEFVQSLPAHEQSFRPPMTAAQTARQLLEYAASCLPAEQCKALEVWLEGASFDEIARVVECHDEATAKRLVRAAVASLRRKFAVAP